MFEKPKQRKNETHPEDEKGLLEMLIQHSETGPYPLHMPGHKRRMGTLNDPFRIDVTEIEGTDDLHEPGGIILEAQQRAAELWGAGKSYFLVNGSTCGVLAAISACFGPRSRGRKLLMARNSHLSVWHAAILERLDTAFLKPQVLTGQRGTTLAGAASPEAVAAALETDGQIGAVCITSPTYEGVVSDVCSIAALCHEKGIPLIVDEAHGAHFGFHPAFPKSAVSCGADIVIQSLHKTLPALTQCAAVHVNGPLADTVRLEKYLRIYQTSSPSYVLMASMDECIRLLLRDGQRLFEDLAQRTEHFHKEAAGLKRLEIIRTDDPSRIVIGTGSGRLSGEQICDILRKRNHLECEMAAPGYVLAIMTVADGQEAFDALLKAVIAIDEEICNEIPEERAMIRLLPDIPVQELSLWQAFGADSETVSLHDSAGKICSDFVGLYPPGIPFLAPGEKIDEKMIAYLENLLADGLNIRGIPETHRAQIRTVAD